MISNAMIMMARMTVKETDLFHTMANGQQDDQVTGGNDGDGDNQRNGSFKYLHTKATR